ncbi:protein TOPAZ1 isoform X2 [Heptranchias perlo]|uniref:protein TOPAZ1 isoform X2 n=1 Tax=Heptranchias perlo TaxID=212740 RepID=UPI003559CA22
MSACRATQSKSEGKRSGSGNVTLRRPGPMKQRARSPGPHSSKPATCQRQLRRSTIKQRMKIDQKHLTERSPPASSDVVMDRSVGEPKVDSTKHLIRSSVRPTYFKRGTEESKTGPVQLCDYIMPKELKGLPRSSICDLFNQCNEVCNKSVKGPKNKRCQARKRKKDHGYEDCKVANVIKNNWRSTELIATIEPLQVTLKRNGCSKINPSEELSKCVKRNHSKSAGMEFTTENVLSGNNTKILLETGPSELSRVIQKRIQNHKVLDKTHLETDTVAGDVEKTRASSISEANSEIGFKPGPCELPWHPKDLVWQRMCQDSTAWSKADATDVTGNCLEEEITALPDRALELTADFAPFDVIVPDAAEGLSESCKRNTSERVHSEASVALFGCARTTPVTLDTCARTRPFKRIKLCPKFWFGSEWYYKQEISATEATGELHSDPPVLETKSGALPCQGLLHKAASKFAGNQGYLESVESAVFLLDMLSLEVPELKAVNKDNLRNKSLLEKNCSCASFTSDRVAKIQPSIHFSKYPNVVIEYGRQLKDAYDNVKKSPSISVLNSSKMANGVCGEENKCPIRKSELNFISSAAPCTKTLISTKLPEFHNLLHNDIEGKATVDYQGHKTAQNKFSPRKECAKEINDIQPTVIPAHQNESLELSCDRLDGQCRLETSEQTGSEGFVGGYPLLGLKRSNQSKIVEVNSDSLFVPPWPDGNCNLEKPFNSLRTRNAENTTMLENQRVLSAPKEPFIATEATADSEAEEILDRSSEKKRTVEGVPDVIRAYEEDALVLDVIQDDPELFGSTSDTDEVMQTAGQLVGLQEAGCKKAELKSVESNPGSELNSRRQKDSNNSTSSAFLYVPKDESSGKLPNCTSLQHNGFKTQSITPVNEENYFEDDTQVEPLVIEGEITESGYNLYQIASNTALVSETDEQQECQGTEISVSSLQYQCSDRPILENNFSGIPPCSESSFQKSALTNDLRFTQGHLLLPTSACAPASLQLNSSEHWTVTRPVASFNYPLELTALPSGYCRYYFITVKGCKKKQCRFGHELKKGDEKFCMEIVQKLMETSNPYLLLRAVSIFRSYYRSFQPGIYCSSQVMHRLHFALLKVHRLQDLFELLNMAIIMKMLPEGEILLNVFDHVASTDSRAIVPNLIEITCKLVEAGLKLQLDQFNYMIHLLNQLQVSHQEIHFIAALKPRLLSHQTEPDGLCDLNFAIAEIEQYKEKGEWNKMGTLFQSLHWNYDAKSELYRIAAFIAVTLVKSRDNGAAVPFCEFAKAVCQKPHINGMAKKLLGRIGNSVMVAYYKTEHWRKARKVLDILQEMQVNFTVLKGLISECVVSRCQIINVAAEIFLKVGCVNRALWLLRESGWTISTPAWPCDKLDVLNRHNLLFSLADATLKSNMYCETLEVLQHLPGFQNVNGTMDIKQYVRIFNNLLDECIQNNCLGASSDTVEFMRSANIPINSLAVRNLITALGRSCLWLKARKQYKKALSSGCYPPIEENLYRKLLPIPCFLSEVEMLLATEMFLVTNASNIQSPSVSKQSLQIVLRRYEDERSQLTNGDYEAAVDRLLAAARISEPKLQIKHTTVNISKEEIFSLEYSSALKWLEQNMKWAGKVWLFG